MLRRFFVAVLFTLLLCTPVLAMKNEPGGFGGIKWGDKLSQHPDLKRKDDHSYYRPGERGNASSVMYSLDKKEGLYWVTICAVGWSNIQRISMACLEQWGEPDSVETNETDDVISLEWVGRQASVLLTYSADTAILMIKDDKRFIRVLNQN